jgi:hypothetical protein
MLKGGAIGMENRMLKVYQTYDSNYKSIPDIKLKGHWLNELGFLVGNTVAVECSENEIIIKNEKVN